ncbi:MAG: hypothetical protein ACOY44_03755 [Pseudomonadota bacterium]
MSEAQKTVDLDALFSQSTPQQQPAIATAEPARAITIKGGFLICPQCGFDHLHLEALIVYAGGEDAAQRPVISLESIGDLALTAPKISLEMRSARDNPSPRRGAVCTDYFCEGCHGKFRLVQSQHKGRTEIHWEAA